MDSGTARWLGCGELRGASAGRRGLLESSKDAPVSAEVNELRWSTLGDTEVFGEVTSDKIELSELWLPVPERSVEIGGVDSGTAR